MSKQETRKPVKYIVLEKSLIGNEVHVAGAEVEYAGLPAENLQPICEEGKARFQEYLASNAERVRKMAADHTPTEVNGSAQAFASAVGAAIAQANATFQAQLSDAVAAAVAKALGPKTARAAKSEAKAEDGIA